MKKRLSIVFFSLCFLGSIIAEAYFIQEGAGNLFSIVALGAVVLITGYLLLDSIRSKLSERSKEIRNYIDQMYIEETGRWNERFTEVQNLQKATYTATKKNTATLSNKLDELVNRIDSLDVSNTKGLQRLTDLQMKVLEGQKKALTLEINYNKENTRQLMKAIGEIGNQTEVGEQKEVVEQLGRIAERIENSTQVLVQELQNLSTALQAPSVSNQYSEGSWNMNAEPRIENLTETGWDVEAEVVVLQDPIDDWTLATVPDSFDAITDNAEESTDETAESGTNWNSIDTELNKLIESWDEEPADEKTPDILPSEKGVIIPEVMEALDKQDTDETQKQEIKPLYEDQNKALSADEIAALFASFGQ